MASRIEREVPHVVEATPVFFKMNL